MCSAQSIYWKSDVTSKSCKEAELKNPCGGEEEIHYPQEGKKESKRMIVTIQLSLQVNTIPGFSQELQQFLKSLGFCPGFIVSRGVAVKIC